MRCGVRDEHIVRVHGRETNAHLSGPPGEAGGHGSFARFELSRGDTAVSGKDAAHVAPFSPFVEECPDGVSQKVGLRISPVETEVLEAAVDTLELEKAGDQRRLAAGRAVASRSGEAGRAGADAFDGLRSKTGFLHIDARGKVFRHGFDSFVL
jgi:hypothetical protein